MSTSEHIVREFWRLMATNDFDSVRQVLAESFVLDWPQSNERIRGPQNFARMNAEYPAQGTWHFEIKCMVAAESVVVTRVRVTDGAQEAVAISFFELQNGEIVRIVEYWPENYDAPAGRAHLTEPLTP